MTLFCQALEEAKAASGALLQLMKHPSLPTVTRSHLLFDAIELLEAPTSPPLFTAADTQELLSHLLVCPIICPQSYHSSNVARGGHLPIYCGRVLTGLCCRQETKEREGRSNRAAEIERAGQDEQNFLEAKLDAVQLALARNLSRAHIAAPLA